MRNEALQAISTVLADGRVYNQIRTMQQRIYIRTDRFSDATGQLQQGLVLRFSAWLLFLAATIGVALFERSALVVALLAAGWAGSGLLSRYRLLGPRAVSLGSFFGGFAWRIVLLGSMFVVLLGFLTLFRETALARTVTGGDVLFVLATTGAVMALEWIGGRMSARGMEDISKVMETNRPEPAAPGDVIEGEVIDGTRPD